MGLKITSEPSVTDVINHLNTKQDVPDLAQYGCVPPLIALVVKHQCHNIVELHSPHSRASYILCKAFDDINVTSICNPHKPHDHIENLNCVQDWSSNVVKTIDDHSLDLVFIHDHNVPYDELSRTLSNWLIKIKPGGIICGRHFGLLSDKMSDQARSLYAFVDNERLVLDPINEHLFVCYNDPQPDEGSKKAPIRMEELND